MSDSERLVKEIEDWLVAVNYEPQYHWFRWLIQQQVQNA